MKDILIAIIWALVLCGPAWAGSMPPPKSVAIAGAVANPGSVTKEDLDRMSSVDVTLSQKTDKGLSQGAFRGALLWTIIDHAGLVNGPEKNAYLRHTILVTGADGYAAAISEGEIDPKLEGKQIILATTKDGVPLSRPCLVVPGDAHAPRSVHDVVSIDVK